VLKNACRHLSQKVQRGPKRTRVQTGLGAASGQTRRRPRKSGDGERALALDRKRRHTKKTQFPERLYSGWGIIDQGRLRTLGVEKLKTNAERVVPPVTSTLCCQRANCKRTVNRKGEDNWIHTELKKPNQRKMGEPPKKEGPERIN